MGSIDGFLKTDRKLPGAIARDERVKNYKEIYIPHSEELTKNQASRCMDCGVPFCHNGCPLGNLIPDFNDAVYNEDWPKATDILFSTNNFPEFTGRICPAPCEGSCVLGINKPPVAIEHIEKSIAEKAFELGLVSSTPPEKENGKGIGIVGSGPAGLAAAEQLRQFGYEVTVYERDEKPGGLLRFGIPDFKLEKWVIERRVDLMEKQGIKFELNCHVGIDLSAQDLRDNHDAILLAGGSTIPNNLNIPGRDLKGVHFAMDFLTQQNRRVSNLDFNTQDIYATDKNVVVIGGGDTGSDCIGTSNRHGAKSVLQFELLEKPPTERKVENPWPEWPLILRTSSSHEEGADRDWSILTKSFVGDVNGNLTGVKTVNIKWTGAKFEEIEGTEKTYPCELALLAIGFAHPEKEGLIEGLGIDLSDRGNVKTDHYQTNETSVFACGDMRRGQSLVVWAISEGREAARAIDKNLHKETAMPSKSLSGYRV